MISHRKFYIYDYIFKDCLKKFLLYLYMFITIIICEEIQIKRHISVPTNNIC